MSPVDLAIEAAGGPSVVAAKLGLKGPNVVSNWRARGQVPAEHVRSLERLSGISRHVLRPDVFGLLADEAQDKAA